MACCTVWSQCRVSHRCQRMPLCRHCYTIRHPRMKNEWFSSRWAANIAESVATRRFLVYGMGGSSRLYVISLSLWTPYQEKLAGDRSNERMMLEKQFPTSRCLPVRKMEISFPKVCNYHTVDSYEQSKFLESFLSRWIDFWMNLELERLFLVSLTN